MIVEGGMEGWRLRKAKVERKEKGKRYGLQKEERTYV